MKYFFTADLHFCHDRGFLYQPRGFNSVDDMNTAIVERWNSIVKAEDVVYILGDVMLNDNEKGIKLLSSLNGELHIIQGNHDTITRLELYKVCPNVKEVCCATYFKYKKLNFFLTHYPCFTGNLEAESLYKTLINLYGHTHQKTNFYNDIPFMYHVGLDSHNCYPVEIDQIIEEIKAKIKECEEQL